MISEVKSDGMVWTYLEDKIPHHTPINDQTDGIVRINRGHFEYYDARFNIWTRLSGNTLRMSSDARLSVIIDWADQKMREERLVTEAEKNNPALKLAKERYELMKQIVLTEERNK
jgi:hypothetical protein